MELIARISRGTVMDQVYLPKKREGFGIGSHVVITPLEPSRPKKTLPKSFFYNIRVLEPIKLKIIADLFLSIARRVSRYDNIIVTGSFLEPGFRFNDIDILLITDEKINTTDIHKDIDEQLGIKAHIIVLNKKILREGLATDPLYQSMLSTCVAKNRFIYKVVPRIKYRILDLHLLKSKLLVDNFDILDGHEKYYLTRNLIAIAQYLKGKGVDRNQIDTEIKRIFHLNNVDEIKRNILDKGRFLKEYRMLYENTFEIIMEGIRRGSEQK